MLNRWEHWASRRNSSVDLFETEAGLLATLTHVASARESSQMSGRHLPHGVIDSRV